jgi:superfamily II DNA or RNA helicase
MFASLERMRFINSCDSLINKVNDWIKNNSNERFILFTSDEKTGLKYNLPMFNSKSADDSVLRDFQNGKINQLCLIKKASAGVTFPNLSNILITAINSNGENLEQMIGRSLLDDTDHSNIHIFVSRESFQLKWLSSALELISTEKIKYMS